MATSILRLVLLGVRLLITLQVDYTEVQLRDRYSAAFDYRTGTSDSRILAQPIFCEETIVLFLETACLLAVLVGLLEQLEEGALALVRLL